MAEDIGEINLFSLKPIEGNEWQSELLFEGQPTGLVIDGVYLEKQYRLRSGYLLFLTENCPFEEGLDIYLLSFNKRILDGIVLGAPYAPGILKRVEPAGYEAFSFSFFGDDRWLLKVLRKPSRKINIGYFGYLSPVKWKRGFFSKRWLTLSCTKREKIR
jgi:hypothetical protein